MGTQIAARNGSAVKGGGCQGGPQNRKTARNFGKNRKTAQNFDENRKTARKFA